MSLHLPSSYIKELTQSINHCYDVQHDIRVELTNMKGTVDEVNNRRNQQMDIILSLVSTLFLPLTVIAGAFGMNFAMGDGGLVVFVLKNEHGMSAFLFICGMAVLMVILFFHSKVSM